MVEGKKRVVGWDGSSFLSFSSAVVCREKLERERERNKDGLGTRQTTNHTRKREKQPFRMLYLLNALSSPN